MYNVVYYASAIMGFLSTVILGLIAWGMRSQVASLRADFHAALAEAELRFVQHVSNKYVARDLLDAELSALPCYSPRDRTPAPNLTQLKCRQAGSGA